FILYGKDHVLAHQRLPGLPKAGLSEDNPLHRVAELGDPVVVKFLAEPEGYSPPDKAFVVRDFDIADKTYVVLSREFSEFGKVPWTLGMYAPRSDWDTQLARLGRSIIGGVSLLVLAVLAAVFLARRIAAPVRNTAEAAAKVGALDLEHIEPLPPSRITELNNQAVAFNQMLDGLKWFQTYVPRQLVRRLVRQNAAGSVESREQELTVMFTDIIGFTAMSETKSPTEIADMLNRHFEVLYQCIEAEGGTLDKYIGDAAMAFWGAPQAQPDHAARACRAALAARKAFQETEPDQRIKIAIHTGPLIVGNIGAVDRMNYTVIGDTVNTCSRIEKLAGDLDAGEPAIILISDATAAQLGDEFKLEAAGEFQVKGRESAVTVYRLGGQNSPDQSI
ncbi:MAG: adenylate/guanylate cyclase domain-containing protein, partial [Aestuariivirgaceae bacterium]